MKSCQASDETIATNAFINLFFSVDMKPPVKVEDVKHEFKTESEPIPIPISASSSASAPLQQPKKEEEYDSSATVRAKRKPLLF